MPERMTTNMFPLSADKASDDKASGIRCRKAPPNNVPDAKLTSISNNFLNKFSLIDKKKIPIRDIPLTSKVEAKIHAKGNISTYFPYNSNYFSF